MESKKITKDDLNQAQRNFSVVKERLRSGEARNIAFKKPMSFYREHSPNEAIILLKNEAASKRTAPKSTAVKASKKK